ncbi:hypothetical protein TNCV_3035741 [Trichonephila clavipes]|nr:hypothetical protein TNCV_3035741 [Trichonephila clavipes]
MPPPPSIAEREVRGQEAQEQDGNGARYQISGALMNKITAPNTVRVEPSQIVLSPEWCSKLRSTTGALFSPMP